MAPSEALKPVKQAVFSISLAVNNSGAPARLSKKTKVISYE
jgi:hypothetical protein